MKINDLSRRCLLTHEIGIRNLNDCVNVVWFYYIAYFPFAVYLCMTSGSYVCVITQML